MATVSIRSILVLAASILSLAACAMPGAGDPQSREAAQLERYRQFAGEPVRDFHFWNLDRWEVLGETDLVVWTNPREAYLLHVQRPCTGLDFANTIALTSTQQRVYARFDSVLFENQRCRIAEIRAVDGKAYKAARRAESDNDKSDSDA